MSVMKTCDCDKSHRRVLIRNANYSYFERPRGGRHYSDYSEIICLNCGKCWRSKAEWVKTCPDITPEESEKMGHGRHRL